MMCNAAFPSIGYNTIYRVGWTAEALQKFSTVPCEEVMVTAWQLKDCVRANQHCKCYATWMTSGTSVAILLIIVQIFWIIWMMFTAIVSSDCHRVDLPLLQWQLLLPVTMWSYKGIPFVGVISLEHTTWLCTKPLKSFPFP